MIADNTTTGGLVEFLSYLIDMFLELNNKFSIQSKTSKIFNSININEK